MTTGRAVLQNISEQIRECLAHAEDCARRAVLETDSQLRRDFLDMEQRWLSLAQSMEVAERLIAFTKNAPKPKLWAASYSAANI